MPTCGAFFSVGFGRGGCIEVQSKRSGHGTFIDQETVISSVAGTIERVNKLVSVRAIGTRYNPEVGDLIVGRITEVWYISVRRWDAHRSVHVKVQPRRWKVGANSRQDAVLMLSSINLPGGVQVGGSEYALEVIQN